MGQAFTFFSCKGSQANLPFFQRNSWSCKHVDLHKNFCLDGWGRGFLPTVHVLWCSSPKLTDLLIKARAINKSVLVHWWSLFVLFWRSVFFFKKKQWHVYYAVSWCTSGADRDQTERSVRKHVCRDERDIDIMVLTGTRTQVRSLNPLCWISSTW